MLWMFGWKVGRRLRGYGQVPTYGSARKLSRFNVALCPCPVDRGTGIISLGTVEKAQKTINSRIARRSPAPRLVPHFLPDQPVVSRPTLRPSALPLVALTALMRVFYSCARIIARASQLFLARG